MPSLFHSSIPLHPQTQLEKSATERFIKQIRQAAMAREGEGSDEVADTATR